MVNPQQRFAINRTNHCLTTREVQQYGYQARNELLKSKLLEIVAAPNSMVEIMNSPDMKPNTPVVKKTPVMMSLYRLVDLFMVAPRLSTVVKLKTT